MAVESCTFSVFHSCSFTRDFFASGFQFRIVHERYFVYLAEKLTGAKRAHLGMTYTAITENAAKEWTAMDEGEKQRFADIASKTCQLLPDGNFCRARTALRSLFTQSQRH